MHGQCGSRHPPPNIPGAGQHCPGADFCSGASHWDRGNSKNCIRRLAQGILAGKGRLTEAADIYQSMARTSYVIRCTLARENNRRGCDIEKNGGVHFESGSHPARNRGTANCYDKGSRSAADITAASKGPPMYN
jgi:hypothetical protein